MNRAQQAIQKTEDGLILNLHIQAGASRDEITGLHGQRVKIRIKAPAVDGKANRALIRFLAMKFAVPIRQVTLVNGEHKREKKVKITQPGQIPDPINYVTRI